MRNVLCKFIFGLVTAIVVAHSVTPHRHHEESFPADWQNIATAENQSNDHDHDKSDHFGTHNIDDYFVNQSDLDHHLAAALVFLLPQVLHLQVQLETIVEQPRAIAPHATLRSHDFSRCLSYRGPPAC